MNATGFIIFTLISIAITVYILVSMINTCRQYKALSEKHSSMSTRYPFANLQR